MVESLKKGTDGKKIDIPLIALSLSLIAGTASLWWFADLHFKKRIDTATLRENVFLTTEWRLLKELKDRTDQLLRDKDREIGDLRLRYRSLLGKDSSAELLAPLAAELAKAEAERQEILSSRLKVEHKPPSTTKVPESVSPGGPLPRTESALPQLLRQQILKLEGELEERTYEAALLSREIGSLRLKATSAAEQTPPPAPQIVEAPPAAAAVPVPAAVQEPPPDAASLDVDSIVALLEREKDLLPAAAAPSLSDIRTRALLRAIVRSPTIRAEYPDLPTALDRYMELYAEEEYLKGKREALNAAVEAIKTLKEK